jgi:hypothetical protein
MTLRVTLSQSSLENLHSLTLLGGADVAVDLHRFLARRVTQQLLGDPRMDARPVVEARRSMAEVVEPHPGQPGALQEPLEALGQPRPVDRVRALRDEDEAIGRSFVRALLLLAVQVGSESRYDERGRGMVVSDASVFS